LAVGSIAHLIDAGVNNLLRQTEALMTDLTAKGLSVAFGGCVHLGNRFWTFRHRFDWLPVVSSLLFPTSGF
jgi:putative flippase GtrA